MNYTICIGILNSRKSSLSLHGAGVFFFIKSMKEIIHPVPASWMEASCVEILLNVFSPV